MGFMFISGVETWIMRHFTSEYSCSIRVIHFGEAILPAHLPPPLPLSTIYSPSLIQKAIIAKRPRETEPEQ